MARKRNGIAMTQGKHFAAGGDHFAALPNKKIHTPKGIARLTVTAATMAAMTGSSLISPFTAFAQTGDGTTQHPAVMSPIAAHAGAASGTGAKSAAQTIADLQKAVDEAKAKEDAAKASYDEAAGPYNEAASARDQAKASYDSAVSAGLAADRAAMDEYARQVAEGKDAADAAGKDLEQAKAGLADAKADASEKDEAYQSALKAAQDAKDALDKAKADAVSATPEAISAAEQAVRDAQAAVDRAQAELDNANATLADAQSKLVATQSAKDSADSVLAAARQNKDAADAKAAAASAAYEQAKADLAAAEAGASGPEYDAAKQKVADAEAALAAARAAQSQCESELEQAQSVAATAQADLNDAQASLSVKQQAAADAESGVNAAQSALDVANADLDAAKQANADAVAKLDAAKQSVKDAESAKATADVELANAKAAKDTADAAVNAAQQKVDEAQAKLDSADAQLKQGAIGFFKAMGADSAIEIIQNCTYKDYTEVGNNLDATSLDNMLAAIPYMKSINEYRKSVGLSELQVTYKLIAAAIANANYSDVKFGHSMQFDTSENLAWNYGTDPKPQWVDQEKAFFDQAVQELYGVTGLIGKDAVDFYKSHSGIESYVNQHFKVAGYPATVGHYLHVISPEIGYMGMAVCSKGTMNGWKTDSFDTANLGWAGSGWNMNPMSVDEYEQKLTSYINGLKNAKSALDAAKADLASKQQAAAGAAATVQQKQDAADSAQADVDAAKQGVADAQRAVDAAKADTAAAESLVSAAEQAKAQADAKLSKLNSIDAGAAIASGHDVNADDALNALFAAAVEARAKIAPAKAILDEKQAAVDELQPGYDAALAAYELAKSDRIAAEQKLSDEIAQQEAEEAAKQQAAYTPKHLAGTDTAQPGSLAQTGDRAGLIGETFVIGGIVLVAAGVFLDQKKRREQM